MKYQLFFVNGREIDFEADGYESDDGTYKFLGDGEVIAEFTKNNIAGLYSYEGEEE